MNMEATTSSDTHNHTAYEVRHESTGRAFQQKGWNIFWTRPGALPRDTHHTLAQVLSAGGTIRMTGGRSEAWAQDDNGTDRWLPVEVLP
jgi:hypothetical protein